MQDFIIKTIGFFFIITMGYLLKKKGIFKVEDRKVISNIILLLALPCVVISSFRDFNFNAAYIVAFILGILSNLVIILSFKIYSHKKTRNEKILYMMLTSGYNIGIFTIPFVSGFLNSRALLMVVMFDIGNAIFVFGGNYAITSSIVDGKSSGIGKTFFKNMFSSVPFVLYIILLVLQFLNIKLPEPVYKISDMIAPATSFLAMLMVGIIFEVKNSKEDRKINISLLVARYLCATIIATLIYLFLPIDLELKKALMIAVFSPISTASVVYCQKLGGKPSVVGVFSSFSFILSMVIMTGICLFL